jgi:FAD/FMN-containing dehydrogenase
MPRSVKRCSNGSAVGSVVLRPDGTAYDEARRVWNGLIDKHPALIARCAGVGDVIDSVNFARENNLLVAVRGGGTTSPATPSATVAW